MFPFSFSYFLVQFFIDFPVCFPFRDFPVPFSFRDFSVKRLWYHECPTCHTLRTGECTRLAQQTCHDFIYLSTALSSLHHPAVAFLSVLSLSIALSVIVLSSSLSLAHSFSRALSFSLCLAVL